MDTEQKKRETWTVHMDRGLFERVRELAEAEGRTIRRQLERLVVAGLEATPLETRGGRR